MKSSEILIDYRKRHKMTVAKFAELLGVSQVFLTHLEHDRRKISEDLFVKLEEFLSKEEIDKLRWTEKLKDVPEEILSELSSLKKENKELREKCINIDSRIATLNKIGLPQYEKTINEASLFFNDGNISEEDKQKLLMAMNEMFFTSKQINKEKYAKKTDKNKK